MLSRTNLLCRTASSRLAAVLLIWRQAHLQRCSGWPACTCRRPALRCAGFPLIPFPSCLTAGILTRLPPNSPFHLCSYPLLNFAAVSALYVIISHRLFLTTNSLKDAVVSCSWAGWSPGLGFGCPCV